MILRHLLRKTILDILGTFSKPKVGMHIINMHFITPDIISQLKHQKLFEEFLSFLNKKCDIIDFKDSHKYIINSKNITKPTVSLSFDDGYEECASIIAPILKKANIKAGFFINSNFIESNITYQESFFNRIKINTKLPMNWHQVESLNNEGHTIGSHTLDHYNLADLNKEEAIRQCLIDKKNISSKLGINIDHFAWPYGEKKHITDVLVDELSKNFKFIYSGTNYKNYFSFNNKVINRRHIEPNWSKKHIKYFLSTTKNV